MGRVNIEIDDELHRAMKAICALKGMGIKEFVELSLRDFLSSKKRGA